MIIIRHNVNEYSDNEMYVMQLGYLPLDSQLINQLADDIGMPERHLAIHRWSQCQYSFASLLHQQLKNVRAY